MAESTVSMSAQRILLLAAKLAALAFANDHCNVGRSIAPGVLPEENVMLNRFRSDPDLFWTPWNDCGLQSTVFGSNGTVHPGMPQDIMMFSVGENDDKIASFFGPAWDRFGDLVYPFSFERNYNGNAAVLFTRKQWWLGYIVATGYLVCLWLGILIMQDREPFDLRGLLAAWNLFLAIFSSIGMVRMVPLLLMMLWHHGFHWTLCRRAVASVGGGPSGLWMMLFIYSKFFELIDTLFLVLRKKKVGFLHWYHHFSVLLYCWHAFMWESSTGVFFAAMNYTVHAIMYLYYFLAAVLARPPKWAFLVTTMQLSQMFFGLIVVVTHLRISLDDRVPLCDSHLPNVIAALVMYATYFFLFADFMVKRFCWRRSCGSQKTETKKVD